MSRQYIYLGIKILRKNQEWEGGQRERKKEAEDRSQGMRNRAQS